MGQPRRPSSWPRSGFPAVPAQRDDVRVSGLSSTQQGSDRALASRRVARDDNVGSFHPSAPPSSAPAAPKASRSVVPNSGVVRQVCGEDGLLIARLARQPGFVEVIPLEIIDLKAALLLQEEIERQLSVSSYRAMLVDATGMIITSRDVNDCMWDWAHSCPLIRKIAVVNVSAVMSVAVEMRAVAHGHQQLKGFNDLEAAVEWVQDVTSTRRSSPPSR